MEQQSLLDQAISNPDVEEVSAPLGEPVAVAEPVEEKEDVLHAIVPNDEPKEVVLTLDGADRTYVQAPLKYFRKMEFFGLVGRTIDEAMSGEDGLTVNSIFGANTPTSVGELAASDFGDLDSFLALVAKIANYAPDFLKDCYVIWLDVPKRERVWAREALDNLEDEAGLAIIETFIDQNWDSIERFFTERIRSVANRVSNLRKKD